MAKFFKDYKAHFSIWMKHWYMHVFFCLLCTAPLWMIGQSLHPVDALVPTGLFFFLLGAWFVFTAQTTLPTFTFSSTLKKTPKLFLKSLLFPFGAALIWGNPYTLSYIAQMEQTKGLLALSVAITATFLLMNLTLLLTTVSSPKPEKNEISPKTSFWVLMGEDLTRMWLLWKSTWKSSFNVLIHILLVFFPIAVVASALSSLVVQLPSNMAWINIIPSIGLFSAFSIWPIIVCFQTRQTFNEMNAK